MFIFIIKNIRQCSLISTFQHYNKHFLWLSLFQLLCLNCVDWSVFHSHDELTLTWSIVSLCAPIHSCLYLLSMILSSLWSPVCVQVNSCFKSNKAYYINSSREFGNDVACIKFKLMPGCPLEWLQMSERKSRKHLSCYCKQVLVAVFLPLAKTDVDLAVQTSLTWHNAPCWHGFVLHIFSCAALVAKYSKISSSHKLKK